MAMKFVVTEVTVENVKKGRTPYSVANVSYTWQGQARTQKVMSFVNPELFTKVKDLSAGDNIEVETSKNAAGYNQWDSVVVVAASFASPAAVSGGRVTGSTYETKEERAVKQALIVKQSCLAQAVAYHAMLPNSDVDLVTVLETAQTFVDWVLEQDPVSLADMPNDDIA